MLRWVLSALLLPGRSDANHFSELGSGIVPSEPDLSLDPDYRYGYTQHATALRRALMDEDTYDKTVPPSSQRAGGSPSQAGTDVSVQIRKPRGALTNPILTRPALIWSVGVLRCAGFFKVDFVDAASGSMRLKIWYRMRWNDDRLAWDPRSYGGVTQFWTRMAEESPLEIWTPDIGAYNTKEGLSETLENTAALVSSNGDVYWSRPGILDVMCKFSGLAAFPFDRLSCGIDVGGWIISGGHQGISLLDDGYAFSNQEPTAGSSYQEYSIVRVNASMASYTYPCCPNEPWPVINYVVTLRRATSYYLDLVITPTIILTILSFGVFFMSFEVGERLGYGITLVLTIEVTKVVILSFIPVCGESLWITEFLRCNGIFALLALCESCIVLFLAYHTGDHIVPDFLLPPVWVLRKIAWCGGFPPPRIKLKDGMGSIAADLVKEFGEPGAESFVSSVAQLKAKAMKDRATKESQDQTPNLVKDLLSKPPFRLNEHHGPGEPPLVLRRPLTPDDSMRFVFFEKLFFQIDSDSNGYVLLHEMDRLLAFLALDSDEVERLRILQALDDEEDGLIQQDEFVQACVLLLWTVPTVQLQWAADNFVEATTTKLDCNTLYWKKAAKRVDQGSRMWIVCAYAIYLNWVFALDMSDNYNLPGYETETVLHNDEIMSQEDIDSGNVMFLGMGPTKVSNIIYIAPAISAVIMVLWIFYGVTGTLSRRIERNRLAAVMHRIKDEKRKRDMELAAMKIQKMTRMRWTKASHAIRVTNSFSRASPRRRRRSTQPASREPSVGRAGPAPISVTIEKPGAPAAQKSLMEVMMADRAHAEGGATVARMESDLRF